MEQDGKRAGWIVDTSCLSFSTMEIRVNRFRGSRLTWVSSHPPLWCVSSDLMQVLIFNKFLNKQEYLNVYKFFNKVYLHNLEYRKILETLL